MSGFYTFTMNVKKWDEFTISLHDEELSLSILALRLSLFSSDEIFKRASDLITWFSLLLPVFNGRRVPVNDIAIGSGLALALLHFTHCLLCCYNLYAVTSVSLLVPSLRYCPLCLIHIYSVQPFPAHLIGN